jgi:hypothetical protein
MDRWSSPFPITRSDRCRHTLYGGYTNPVFLTERRFPHESNDLRNRSNFGAFRIVGDISEHAIYKAFCNELGSHFAAASTP